MQALYLPGNSPVNREMTYELASRVAGFESSTVIEYPHWSSDTPAEGLVDIDQASDALVETFAARGGDFTVIAKSIGVNVCLRAQTVSNSFDPSQVVFIGAPLNEEVRSHNPVDRWLKGYKTPSLWLQNKNDSVIRAEALQQYLNEIGLDEADFVGLNGDGHGYSPEVVAEIINEYLAPTQTAA